MIRSSGGSATLVVIRAVGVHEVPEAEEPCHLVELEVELGDSILDLGSITQEWPDQPSSRWQVPYDEYVWDAAGTPVMVTMKPLEGLAGAIRVAFFFFYLQQGLPLKTPVGDLHLPAPSPRPPRLAGIQWVSQW